MATPHRRNHRASPQKKRGKPKHPKPEPGECIDPGCGRPAYARGMCQTHHRQLLITGTVKPIRPYRKRNAGTVKFSGLRLSPLCAGTVEAYAEKRGISRGAAIAEILENWLTNKPKDGDES